MKQTFIIKTKKGMTSQELQGCLEDTLGRDQEIEVCEQREGQ